MRLDIYNKVGNRPVNLYACIYKFDQEKLVVCFNAGDTAPREFNAGPDDSSVMLTFRRASS